MNVLEIVYVPMKTKYVPSGVREVLLQKMHFPLLPWSPHTVVMFIVMHQSCTMFLGKLEGIKFFVISVGVNQIGVIQVGVDVI